MNKLKNDDFLKDIIQNSRKEITNPQFDQVLMQKIQVQDNRRKTAKNILLYALFFLTVDAILFTFLKLMYPKPDGASFTAEPLLPKATVFTHSVQSFFAHNNGWLLPVSGFVFLLSILAWASSGLGSSRVRQT